MSQRKLSSPTNVLSLRAVRIAKEEANCHEGAKAEYLAGATEPPVPFTAEHLLTIKAYLNATPRRHGAQAAKRTPPATTPQAKAAGPAVHRLDVTPITQHLDALSSSFRTLAVALILIALLPALILGAILWIVLSERLSSDSVVLSLNEGAVAEARAPTRPPVISVPTTLQATAGEHVGFPITLEGSAGVPGGSRVAILGLPAGTTVSTGRPNGETGWNVEPAEIDDLRLMLPKKASGDAKLAVQLLTSDGHVLADAATILKVTAGPEASIPVHRVKTQPIEAHAWD